MAKTTPAGTRRASQMIAEDFRTSLTVEALKKSLCDSLLYTQARLPSLATRNDLYLALAYTVRDRLVRRWMLTADTYKAYAPRTVCYFSAEFLLGPHLGNAIMNLGIEKPIRQALVELDLNLDDLLDIEPEPGLGNGGLGRLAACYLDSLSTLQIPAIGYGIRYEFGIFRQDIVDGWQVERTDKWLATGNPWEIPQPHIAFDVPLGGRTEGWTDDLGRYRVRWLPERTVRGVAYDTTIPGFHVGNANLLRLWRSEPPEQFDFQAFNAGDYYRAVHDKVVSENLTKVLYPNDNAYQGKRLRLAQQYFFVCCSLQDMIRIHLQKPGATVATLHEKYATQLNDTHPAIAVAELMRLLLDEHLLPWDEAWHIASHTLAYTNHTLLPEALEKWPLDLFASLLPRHLEIVYEINRRFLDTVRERFPGDDPKLARLSIIDESGPRHVRMAHLAAVGSHAINGVAQLHSELLQATVMKDFHDLWPERFSNKTNGVTPRRFLFLSNPRLRDLITEAIGEDWLADISRLKTLEPLADDASFQRSWREVKLANKRDLADWLRRRHGVDLNPDSLFDVQVKRIHEYKRQHLNALHVLSLYLRLKRNPGLAVPPRTVLLGGKAAPGYFLAKLIIKFFNAIAEVVNHDPETRDRLRAFFIPNFSVKNAQHIYPAAELSEQISTAGKEASGTGNMKFALNGALTIGTLDGANIEIRERVGPENFFLFGLTAAEVEARRAAGYRPGDMLREDPRLQEVIDFIASGQLAHGDTNLFRPLIDSFCQHDEYFLCADFKPYCAAQDAVNEAYTDADRWTRMSILNVARMGHFSSDRAIREYCEDIWKVKPFPVAV